MGTVLAAAAACCARRPGFRVPQCLRVTPNGHRLAVTLLVQGTKYLTSWCKSSDGISSLSYISICLSASARRWRSGPDIMVWRLQWHRRNIYFQRPSVRSPDSDSRALLEMCTQVARSARINGRRAPVGILVSLFDRLHRRGHV